MLIRIKCDGNCGQEKMIPGIRRWNLQRNISDGININLLPVKSIGKSFELKGEEKAPNQVQTYCGSGAWHNVLQKPFGLIGE